MALQSLIATGTKVWIDGVEPGDVAKNRSWGATGATSKINLSTGFPMRLLSALSDVQ